VAGDARGPAALPRIIAVSVPFLESWATAWVTLALIAAIVEVSIPHFGLIFVSLGGVAAAIAAFLGFGLPVQIVAFIIAVSVGFAVLRPRIIGRGAPGVPSRTQILIGREGIVTLDIESTVGSGRVNVEGQDWAARAATPLAAGTRIKVVGADGIVLEVKPA
jgi:membrane protein implicated in regulation of membrane protease activity